MSETEFLRAVAERARLGPVPTLIEWDNDVPAFSMLAGEAMPRRSVSCTWSM